MISIHDFLKGYRRKSLRVAKHYDRYDLDIRALLSLLQESDQVAMRRITCIPDTYLCLFQSQTGKIVTRQSVDGTCPQTPKGHTVLCAVRAGLIVMDCAENPVLYKPHDLLFQINACRKAKKRFIVCNLGLYWTPRAARGHANALMIDLKYDIIERYDPFASREDRMAIVDENLERLFRKHLSPFKYVGTRLLAPSVAIQRVADSHDGMCVTFSFAYVLMRLLNPNSSPGEIQELMLYRSPAHTRTLIQRLNAFMIEHAIQ